MNGFFGYVAVLGANRLNDNPSAATALIGEVFGLGCGTVDQLLLAGIGTVAIEALLAAMQQIWQSVFAMNHANHGPGWD
ncbi:hypothetical protein [Rhodoferax fermentans]|uniref:hypothetical protein n=1 Tax=Rhodoferax fermentans TaxID=28066 RepID=UPI001F5B3A40|nr:hypothetical protein [Rhodoferax fermentans]